MKPSSKPTAKVQAANISGAIAVILLWLVGQAGIDMPAEVAGAVVLVVSGVAGYVKTDPLIQQAIRIMKEQEKKNT